MGKAKVVSDRLAKVKCREWLEKSGFTDIKPARRQSCDLIGRKSNKTYYIEIKYSSKEEGGFFGTVMLTEMFQAICNKENYLFLVCRGKGDNINDWFFKLFSVEGYIKCCTLTTPIFLYHLDVKDRFHLTAPKFSESTVLASEKLIKQMWKDFKKWKSKPYLSREGGLIMSSVKYILTKYERILRVEKVEYTVEIPRNTRNKLAYAHEQVLDSNHTDCKVVDIPVSKMLDEEVHSLRKIK